MESQPLVPHENRETPAHLTGNRSGFPAPLQGLLRGGPEVLCRRFPPAAATRQRGRSARQPTWSHWPPAPRFSALKRLFLRSRSFMSAGIALMSAKPSSHRFGCAADLRYDSCRPL